MYNHVGILVEAMETQGSEIFLSLPSKVKWEKPKPSNAFQLYKPHWDHETNSLIVSPMLSHMPTLLHLDHTENENKIGQMLDTIVGVLKSMLIFGVGWI